MHCEAIEERLFAGEERWLVYDVVACNPRAEPYTIQSATYIIQGFGADGGDVSGNCVVEGNTVKVFVKPTKIGNFTMTFTFLIADETIKIKVRLHICE